MSGVLVTGARGFIGAPAVAQLAAAGHEVHAAGRGAPPDGLPDGVTWHRADLLAPGGPAALVAAADPDAVLHLAWDVTPGRFWGDPANLDWTAMTLALARALAGAGPGRRLVAAGTCAEYDWGAGPVLGPGTPLAPGTLYGVAKDATRRVLEAFGDQTGLEVAWGRVFWLYGPREDPRRLVSSVARRLVAGERAPTSAGTQRLDFLHVDDVAGAFAALTRSPGVLGPVDLGSGRATAVADVVRTLAAATGGEDRVGWGEVPTPTGQPPELRADPARLRDEVGFTPHWDLDEGLRATAAWWQEQARRR